MIKRDQLLLKVSDTLAYLQAGIAGRGVLGRFDIHKAAETFFCGFLNRVYGYNLTNLNFVEANYPAIDLGEIDGDLAIQITAQNDSTKVEATLDMAFKHDVYKKYKRIKIFMINEKKSKYNITVPKGMVFAKATGIVDLNDVRKHLEKADTEILVGVEEYLLGEMSQLDDDKPLAPEIAAHDREQFLRADKIMSESQLTVILNTLHHGTYLSGELRPLDDFVHFFKLESNQFISGELNVLSNQLSRCLERLFGFVAIEFFYRRGTQGESLYLKPDLNPDMEGDGSKEQLDVFFPLIDKLGDLIADADDRYILYRRRAKRLLIV